MKNIILILIAAFALLTITADYTKAVPNSNNPNVVAYYVNSPHSIPLDPAFSIVGQDLVMANGKSGNFNQWFWNEDIGYHSVWLVTKNGICPSNAVLIPNANPLGPEAGWGHHLVEGADYCVITNEFNPPSN